MDERYPCFCDKSDKFFKDKHTKKKAFREIEFTLGMEEGKNDLVLFIGNFLYDLKLESTILFYSL